MTSPSRFSGSRRAARSLATIFVASLVSTSASLAPPVRAQEVNEPSRTLTMDAAVREAMEASPTLRAAVLTSRSAERLVAQTEAAFPFRLQLDASGSIGNTPQLAPTFRAVTQPDGTTMNVPTGTGIVTFPYTQSVDLGAQLTRALPWGMTLTARVDAIRTYRALLPTATSQQLTIVGPGYGLNAQLSVTQSLLRGFGEDVGLAPLHQAQADRDVSDAARDRTASTLLRDVLVAYWELWYAERVLAIQREARDVIERQHDDATRRSELGALAGTEALTLEAQLATADTAIASAELVASTAAITLARQLGRRGEALPTTEPTPPALAEADDTRSPDELAEHAPEVLEARARIASAEAARIGATQALMPVLDVGASVEVLGLGYDDVGQTFSNFASFTAVQALGTLTYQTALDDTQLHMAEARASLAVEVAEAGYEAARTQALADVRAASLADRLAARRVALAERAVDVARRALAAEEQRHALGAGLLVDVLAATQTLRQAELDHARAEVDAQEARVRSLHLRGELLARFDERAPE